MQNGVSFNVSQLDIPMLKVQLYIIPPPARSDFNISHSHALSLAPSSWLSPMATGQV